jgi:phosphatidylserine/phosphatidylglycerophosphate/cardiolipin synthase-like enzyme
MYSKRSRPWRTTVLATAVTVCSFLGLGVVTGATRAAATPDCGGTPITQNSYTPGAGVTTFFNIQPSQGVSSPNQTAIVDELNTLIDAVPSGQVIRVNEFHMNDQSVVDHLLGACARGVHVRVVLDHDATISNTIYNNLAAVLGTNDAASSWVIRCAETEQGCLSQVSTAIMHNKFVLFSQTGTASNVILQTSANLDSSTTSESGNAQWNNAVVIVPSNATIYTSYQTYFVRLGNAESLSADNDYYDNSTQNGLRFDTTDHITASYSPRSGSTNSTDTIYQMLTGITTCHNTNGGSNTQIRVVMSEWNRPALATELWNLEAAGCDVNVIFRLPKASGDNGIGTTTLANLTKQPSGTTRQIDEYYFCGVDKQANNLHSKYMWVAGDWNSTANSSAVVTGSEDWTNSGLRDNDDMILEIDNSGVLSNYRTNTQNLVTATGSSSSVGGTVVPSTNGTTVSQAPFTNC